MTAAEALQAAAGGSDERTVVTDASEWLSDFLEFGSRPTTEVRAEAERAGFAWAAVRRAKSALGIKATKGGLSGGWLWLIPEGAHEGAQGKSMSAFEDAQAPSKMLTNLAPGKVEHLRPKVEIEL